IAMTLPSRTHVRHVLRFGDGKSRSHRVQVILAEWFVLNRVTPVDDERSQMFVAARLLVVTADDHQYVDFRRPDELLELVDGGPPSREFFAVCLHAKLVAECRVAQR